MWFAENTQHDLSIRPPRHLKRDKSNLANALAPEHATQRFKILPVTPNGFWHVPTQIEVARQATSATRNDLVQRLKHPQITTLVAIAIGRTTATSRSRLLRRTRSKTVVDGCAPSPGPDAMLTVSNVAGTQTSVLRVDRSAWGRCILSQRQRQDISPPATPSARGECQDTSEGYSSRDWRM